MSDIITQSAIISAKDGTGEFSAYVAMPKDVTSGTPAIIVIQEIFGVNAVMRGKCEALATQGYVAICPDLFWRIEPNIQITDKTEEEWAKAFELFGKFDVDKGVEDLASTLAAVRSKGPGLEAAGGKVGCVGYCLGGKLAYLVAARTDIDASVGYYGVHIDEMLDEAKNITTPLLLHIAEKDEFVPPEAQAKIVNGLKGHSQAATYSYPADHAFSREGGAHYDETCAALANQRTKDFLAAKLR